MESNTNYYSWFYQISVCSLFIKEYKKVFLFFLQNVLFLVLSNNYSLGSNDSGVGSFFCGFGKNLLAILFPCNMTPVIQSLKLALHSNGPTES